MNLFDDIENSVNSNVDRLYKEAVDRLYEQAKGKPIINCSWCKKPVLAANTQPRIISGKKSATDALVDIMTKGDLSMELGLCCPDCCILIDRMPTQGEDSNDKGNS